MAKPLWEKTLFWRYAARRELVGFVAVYRAGYAASRSAPRVSRTSPRHTSAGPVIAAA
jgi:hypothetical protein